MRRRARVGSLCRDPWDCQSHNLRRTRAIDYTSSLRFSDAHHSTVVRQFDDFERRAIKPLMQLALHEQAAPRARHDRLEELVDEAALADSRLTDEGDELDRACAPRPLERIEERVELPPAADERCSHARRDIDADARAPRWLPTLRRARTFPWPELDRWAGSRWRRGLRAMSSPRPGCR